MERKALGKGISALIPMVEEERSQKIVFLRIEQVKPNPFQPRENFDSENMEELIKSIKEKGIIQPILVRPKGDEYELIAGERRLRAANMLNLKEIPVIIKDVQDQDSLELSLIENIQRQELNPIEEAHAYQYLIDKFKLTQEEISEVLGKSRVSITNTLRLLKLPIEIQEEIKNERLTFAHGRALLEIEDTNLQRRLVQDVISKSLSVRELENLIKARRTKTMRLGPGIKVNGTEPYLAILEQELQQIFATKIRIIKKKKRGHILIEFYSQEDLQRIAERLKAPSTS